MRIKKSLFVATAVAAVALGGMSTAMADGNSNSPRNGNDRSESADQVLLATMQDDLGVSEAEAKQILAEQEASIKLDKKIKKELGKAFAGSVIDSSTGKLTVMVSSKGKVDEAEEAGAAEVKVVDRSLGRLNGIKAQLDKAAGAKGNAAQRQQATKPSKAVAALQSWSIDPESNTVQVTSKPGKLGKAKKQVAKYGEAVSVVEGPQLPQTTDGFWDGGDIFTWSGSGGYCSNGINVRNTNTGAGYMITAGHCLDGSTSGPYVYGHGGTYFGYEREAWFPGYDDAIVQRYGSWTQGAWVDTNPNHGSSIRSYSGYTDAPVGTWVCESGYTSKYSCGKIRGKNETVTYGGTDTVYGLTRTDTCVEKGDSGGANISAFYNGSYWYYKAEGVNSGASLYWANGRWNCGEKVGASNTSWYYPIADSLAYYGPKYGVTVW